MTFGVEDDNIIIHSVNVRSHIAHIEDDNERKILLKLLNGLYWSSDIMDGRGFVHGISQLYCRQKRSTTFLDSFGNEIFDCDILEVSQAKNLNFVFWKKDWRMWLSRSLEENYYMGGGMLSGNIHPGMRIKVIGNLYDPEFREVVVKAWKHYFKPESHWRPEGSYKVIE